MSEDQFHDWCVGLRKTIVDLWDNHDLPPIVGYTEEEIVDQFKQMESFPVHVKFPRVNEETGKEDVIRNISIIGNAVNSFFPAMMKTPISYAGNGEGRSIYDFFARDDLLERFKTYARRHFKRDSFYHYSNPIKARDPRLPDTLMVDNGVDFIKEFSRNTEKYMETDKIAYWLCPVKEDSEYTGYDDKLKGQVYLKLTRKEIEDLDHQYIINIGEDVWSNVDFDRSEIYTIRFFELGQKLFPIGLKAFKISFSQYAVNFPPLTAKYLIERYTNHIEYDDKGLAINVYDSSMGWGGRLLGAMAVRDDRRIHYIGTDPNTDNTKRYREVYDFYINNVNKGGLCEVPHNSAVFYDVGSEVIHENISFQGYKGHIDFFLTSPPYWNREQYSKEETQSWVKFPSYDEWKKGFLEPTIKTICEYLDHDRYACWNIADIKIGKDLIPLENDSIELFKKHGMEYIETLKMGLSPMPGGNRTREDGTGTTKNSVRVDGMLIKFEPIFVFRKP
jgi:hypothetical protein